jgi:hypothetical protein
MLHGTNALDTVLLMNWLRAMLLSFPEATSVVAACPRRGAMRNSARKR